MSDEPFISRVACAHRSASGGRPENEDRVAVVHAPDGSALLAVVADGLGGCAGGEIAAEIAVEVFRKVMAERPPVSRAELYDLLLSGFEEADRAIRGRSEADAGLTGLGATAAAVLVRDGQMLHLYAGDCRVYHFRRGSLLYTSRDQNVAEVLAEAGQITPEEVRWHPMRNVVTSSLGDPRGRLTVAPPWNYEGSEQPAFRDTELGDVILLCSDGLTEVTVPAMIEHIVRASVLDAETIAETCLRVALAMNVDDNVSLIVLVIRDHPFVGTPIESAQAEDHLTPAATLAPPSTNDPEVADKRTLIIDPEPLGSAAVMPVLTQPMAGGGEDGLS